MRSCLVSCSLQYVSRGRKLLPSPKDVFSEEVWLDSLRSVNRQTTPGPGGLPAIIILMTPEPVQELMYRVAYKVVSPSARSNGLGRLGGDVHGNQAR